MKFGGTKPHNAHAPETFYAGRALKPGGTETHIRTDLKPFITGPLVSIGTLNNVEALRSNYDIEGVLRPFNHLPVFSFFSLLQDINNQP